MEPSKKVLIVDDDPQVLDLMVDALSGIGCQLLPARDGAEAFELFQAERPPLVVTDLKMPKMDGLALMKAVKEVSPRTEVLITTAHGDMDSAIEGIRQGASDYLLKPVSLHLLFRRVSQALERHRLAAEREARLEELEQRVQAWTAALAESQQRLRAVFDGIKDSLAILDQAFKVLSGTEGAGSPPRAGAFGIPSA